MTHPKEHAAPGDHPTPRKSTVHFNNPDETTTMTHDTEERKSERRHETTVGDVTAWAGPWEPDTFGARECSINSTRFKHLGSIYIVTDTIIEKHTDDRWRPAEALVLAEVLKEAAALAQGGEVGA